MVGEEGEKEEAKRVGQVHDEPTPEVLPSGVHLDMFGDVAELPFQVSAS